MKVTLVRHATLLLETSLGRVLVDPMLRPAGSTPAIEDTPNQRSNPLVELPSSPEEIVRGVDLCIVTHLHSDHFDDAADAVLPRDLPILTQPESAGALRERVVHLVAEHGVAGEVHAVDHPPGDGPSASASSPVP